MQLDPRARILLKRLIEQYITDGHPIGSRQLSKISGLELSPASIRNIMSDLEEMGLIVSPHTSAGRIPTPRGYRLFVDALLSAQTIDEQSLTEELEQRLNSTIGHPQKLISSAAQILSSLSQFAGVVSTSRRSSIFQQIEFVKLSEKRILLVLVTPDGDVQNRLLITEFDYSMEQLNQAALFLNQHYSGLTFDIVQHQLKSELNQLSEKMFSLMQTAIQAGKDAQQDSEVMIVSGESNLLQVDDLAHNMDSLRKLFTLFEQKTDLLRLLDLSSHAEGIQIFIGGESQVMPVEQMSIITAPYEVNGQIVGTLGVIGPTRMAYERVIPIVDITARLLSSALSHGEK